MSDTNLYSQHSCDWVSEHTQRDADQVLEDIDAGIEWYGDCFDGDRLKDAAALIRYLLRQGGES